MDKKKRVLISFDTVRPGFEELSEWSDVIRKPAGESFTRDEMMEIGSQYDALATQFTFPVDRELIDAFPNIKLIANYGVGYNNIDVAYAHSKGITVTNTPRAVVQSTAELTMGLLLSCSRKIAMWDRHMRCTESSDKSLSDSSSMARDHRLWQYWSCCRAYGSSIRHESTLPQATPVRSFYRAKVGCHLLRLRHALSHK